MWCSQKMEREREFCLMTNNNHNCSICHFSQIGVIYIYVHVPDISPPIKRTFNLYCQN